MPNGAADDAALHVAPPLIAGQHAVADQKGGGADVIGNHAQALVAQVGAAGLTCRGLDQRVENIDLVIAVHVLQDGSQALQPHAGIDTRRRQRLDRAVRLHVVLHEHVVPDFDVAVAVLLRAARGAAGNGGAVVIKNLAAGAARAGVGHHPEIVGGVFGALVVADAHHALGRQANFLRPDVVSLVVVDINRGPELVGG